MNKKLLLASFAILLLMVWIAAFIYSSAREKPSREIAALVNSQPIYVEQVEKELTTLTPEQKEKVERIDVLDFLVEKRLLLQEAEKAGIKASQREVDQFYNTYANPKEDMAEQNLTEEEFMDRLTEQLLINKLLDEKLGNDFVIKDSEVKQVYELNYKGKNVSLKDVENEIAFSLLNRKRENTRISYLNSLKLRSNIQVFTE